jgi:hypothetical protein
MATRAATTSAAMIMPAAPLTTLGLLSSHARAGHQVEAKRQNKRLHSHKSFMWTSSAAHPKVGHHSCCTNVTVDCSARVKAHSSWLNLEPHRIWRITLITPKEDLICLAKSPWRRH